MTVDLHRELTAADLFALREIADGRKLRSFSFGSPTIRALERVHVIRRGPESQHRYGPLTKLGRKALADE